MNFTMKNASANRADRFTFSSYEKASSFVRAATSLDRLPKTGAVSVEAVKQAVAVHVSRHVSTLYPRKANSFVNRQDVRRRSLAVTLGESYHNNIAPLYSSSRASVCYGAGGTEGVDYDAYSKSYGYAARWKDAGARIEGQTIILENYKANEKARFVFPFKTTRLSTLTTNKDILLHGDLYALKQKGGSYVRYALVKGKLVKSGVAVSATDSAGKAYFEHGRTIKECQAEAQRKRDLVAEAAKIKALNAKMQRKARLLARLSTKLTANFTDARSVGHCNAGILSWCTSRGIDPNGSVSLSTLSHDADRRAQLVALQVARRCIASNQ